MQKKTKVLLSSIFGNALEFYDFTLFGAFTLKFTEIFWTQTNSNIAALNKAFFVFGIAFFFRPLGALFFGAIGDRLGRRKALALSIILMGLATFGIGCVPTYATYGLLGPSLIILLRCIQGFCLGGENNGSAIFILEHLKHRRGLAGALILTGGAFGTVLAYGASVLASIEGMPDHAWRWPFLLGLFIALLGFYIRQKLPEPETFVQNKKTAEFPLLTIWNNYKGPLACTIGIGGVNVALAYTNTVYLHAFISKIPGWSNITAIQMGAVAVALFGFVFAPIMGYLSDRFQPKNIMYMGCLAISLLAFPLFWTLSQGTTGYVIIGVIISAFITASFNAPSNAYLNTLFPSSLRYTGISFGYALGAAIFGGMAPSYYTFIIDKLKTSPGYYLVAMALLGAISIGYKKKHHMG